MVEFRSFLKSTSVAMAALSAKLGELGGKGKLAERDWQIRNRLGWHTKPKTVIRHLLYGERRVSVEEARQIEAAHLRWCAEKADANRRENAALFDTMRRAIVAMEASDPEFFGPQVEALRELLDHDWNLGADKSEKA